MKDLMLEKFFDNLPMMMFEDYITDLTEGKKPGLIKEDLKAREQAMKKFGAKNVTAPIVLMFAAFSAGVDCGYELSEKLYSMASSTESNTEGSKK